MTDTDAGSHIIVHLIDGDSREISQHPTTTQGDESLVEAAVRVLEEQQELQNKHFLVENIVESPKRGRHKGES